MAESKRSGCDGTDVIVPPSKRVCTEDEVLITATENTDVGITSSSDILPSLTSTIIDTAGTLAAMEPFDSNNNSSTFTFCDVFAGVGGFRVGLNALGGSCLWSCEKDSKCRQTYEANFSWGHPPFSDIQRADFAVLPKGVDVLAAGFPCQDFSALSQTQAGLDGNRGVLFFDLVRMVRETKPKALFFENVRGLVTMNDGAVLQTVISMLEAEGYTVKHQLINSVDLLPQYRLRVYIVGFLDTDSAARFEFPVSPRIEPDLNVIVEGEGKLLHGTKELHARTLGEILEPRGYPFTPHFMVNERDWAKVKKNKGSSKYGYIKRFVWDDDVADTLLASYRSSPSGMAQFVPSLPFERYNDAFEAAVAARESTDENAGKCNKKKANRVSDPRPRFFTPRECHRIMGFPESFVEHPRHEDSWRQMGNAVTPPVIALIGANIVAALQDNVEMRASGAAAAVALCADSMPIGERRTAFEGRKVDLVGDGSFNTTVGALTHRAHSSTTYRFGNSAWQRHLVCRK